MTGGLTVVFQGGFGRAAEKLADTIRHVVDISVGGDRIRAKAQAEADSAVIAAEGRAHVQEIEARAIERLRNREARRQRNIESITLKALELPPPAPEQISAEPVSEDWTTRFFEECQDISDEQMQQIWSRILAGEVNQPGSFAPKTLSVVRDLTKHDANLFAKLCEFVWLIPGAGFVPVVHDAELPLFGEAGLNFATLTHLTSIGLIEFNSIVGYGLSKPVTEIAPSFCGVVHQLKSDGGVERRFEIGHTMFTAVGIELAKVSNARGSDAHAKTVLEQWSQMGWKEAGQATGTPELGGC